MIPPDIVAPDMVPPDMIPPKEKWGYKKSGGKNKTVILFDRKKMDFFIE